MHKTLLELDDDCLLEICKYLTISETFQLIGAIGSRIDAIAYQKIAYFKHFNISFREYPNFSAEQLKVIGKNLKTINLSVGYLIQDDKVLDLLQPLCTSAAGASLRQLTIHYIEFNTNYLLCISQVASQLQYLDLSFCELTDELLKPLLEKCTKLKQLIIIANYSLNGESLNTVNAGNLEMLEFEVHENWNFDVNEFFTRYPHVFIIAYAKGRAEKVLRGNLKATRNK